MFHSDMNACVKFSYKYFFAHARQNVQFIYLRYQHVYDFIFLNEILLQERLILLFFSAVGNISLILNFALCLKNH
jgi:hypothetical protein